MKKILIIVLFTLSSTMTAEALYKVTITHPLEIYSGGSLDEALALSEEWRQKVLLKNPHMAGVDYLLEKQSDTRYELLVVYNYKDRETAVLANQQLGGLIQKAWPDEEKRKAFFTKLQSYIVQEEKVTHRYDVIIK